MGAIAGRCLLLGLALLFAGCAEQQIRESSDQLLRSAQYLGTESY